MMLHHLARLEMMKAEEQGINLTYEEALNIVNKQVMANDNTFKVIDMQSLIQQHMDGHISEQQLIDKCKAVLGR